MDDHDENWEKIGISISSSSSKGPPVSFLPPSDNNSYVDVEESNEIEEHDDDDDDYYEDDDDDYYEDDYDEKSGLACPFCSEDFDVLGLFCHIDVDHHKEAQAAICPICVTTVDINMAVHLITQHETILKILCKKKFRDGGSRPALSSLKKEFRDKHLHSHPKGSSHVNSSSSIEPDSLLLPFLYNPQPFPKPQIVCPPIKASPLGSIPHDSNLERDMKMSDLPDKGEEKVQRCEFVRGLLFSTIFGGEF